MFELMSHDKSRFVVVCDICRLQTGRLYIVLPIRIYTIYTYTYIPIYLYTYIPIPIRRSASLANPSASLQVCSLYLSHTGFVVTYTCRYALFMCIVKLVKVCIHSRPQRPCSFWSGARPLGTRMVCIDK